MAMFRSFMPDPEIGDPEDEDFGIGTWTYDDGTTAYGKGDREEALQLWQSPEQADLRTAAVDTLGGDTATDALPPAPEPLGSEMAPPAPPALPLPTAAMPQVPGGLRAAGAEVRGTPLSPEQLQERQQSALDRAQQQAAAVQLATAQREAGRNEAFQTIEQHNAALKADKLAEQQKAAAIKLEAESNIQEALSQQIDPGRVIKGMSTGDVILGALAIALGSLGQTMQQRAGTNAPNLALNAMQRAIDEDIQAQKDDKKSRLAHWTRVLGDAEMGERAAKAEMWNAAGQMAQAQAQRSQGNAEAQALATTQVAEIQARAQAETQALADRESERLSIKYAPPEVPKGAGADPVAELQKRLAARKAYEESGASPEQLAQFDKAFGIPSPEGESAGARAKRIADEKAATDKAAMTEGEGKAEAAWETMQQYGSTVGLQRDPQTGRWATPDDGSVLGWKWGKWTELNVAREAAIDGLARLQTGAAISADEEARFKKLLGDSNASQQQIATHLNALEALVQSRRKQNRRQPTSAPEGWK